MVHCEATSRAGEARGRKKKTNPIAFTEESLFLKVESRKSKISQKLISIIHGYSGRKERTRKEKVARLDERMGFWWRS